MPLYDYECNKCGRPVEIYKPMGELPPICCGVAMAQQFKVPPTIRMTNERGRISRSKGYKEGYAKDYYRDVRP